MTTNEIAADVTAYPRSTVLRTAVQLASDVPGNIIEFGVADGASTRVIRNELLRLQFGRWAGERKRIYACDSFNGLPEKYENLDVGAFAGRTPSIWGVNIVGGYFDASLTPTLASEVGLVALASLDADLYSSTLTALRWLTPLLHTGSLLLFDEYLGEQESERRAHDDWSSETGVETVVIASYARDPSGLGTHVDQRVLRQVIGADTMPARKDTLPTMSGVSRRAYNVLTRSFQLAHAARFAAGRRKKL